MLPPQLAGLDRKFRHLIALCGQAQRAHGTSLTARLGTGAQGGTQIHHALGVGRHVLMALGQQRLGQGPELLLGG